MECLLAKTLQDGSALCVLRFVFPGETSYPEWLPGVFEDDAPADWSGYYRDVFSGASADEITDVVYVATVDGAPASKMWFGYSRRSRIGNFGNVVTRPEFRRRGLMSENLKLCVADFLASPALSISCDAAATAAPVYHAAGFEWLFGEKHHPMAMVKLETGSFSRLLEQAYGNADGAVVRVGRRGDRFDCDKLLAYAPCVYLGGERRTLLSPWIPDYLNAFQHVQAHRASLAVVESRAGFCAGYAWTAECAPGRNVLDFVVHASFAAYAPALFEMACAGLSGTVLAFPDRTRRADRESLKRAGFHELACNIYEKRL